MKTDASCDIPVVIHPGFAKAMTSSMQDVLLAGHSQVNHLGTDYCRPGVPFETSRATAQFVRIVSGSDSLGYCDSEVRKCFDEGVAARLDAERVNTISDECLTYACNADRIDIAERLKAFFPQAKVVFTIRNQRSLIESVYFWLWFRHATVRGSFKQWLMSSQDVFRGVLNDWFLRQYQYHQVISAYREVFSPDRIGVLAIEQLGSDPEAFCGRLGEFMEIDPKETQDLLTARRTNVRHSKASIRYIRTIYRIAWFLGLIKCKETMWPFPGRFNRAVMGMLDKLFGRPKAAMDQDCEAILEAYYSEGNSRLAGELSLPLEEYGYPM